MIKHIIMITLVICSVWIQTRIAHADAGCEGACGNRKKDAEGWCGHCSDHCKGGTEAECTRSCGDPWDEGPCLKQADGNVKQCYKNCNGNKGCEGNCGGDYKRDQMNACHSQKATANDKRQGCLNMCGGQKGCRDSWCKDDGGDRKACYKQVGEAYDACKNTCGAPAEKCSDEKCLGVVRWATCNGKFKATGFCVGFSWKL